jgi:iron complex outermembrane receptor protein
MQKKVQLSLILVALVSSLYADKTKVELMPLTIESTALQTDELKSTDSVEVYTQDDIEKAHVQNVYEFLNTQTSVTTMPSYGNPFSQKIDMHGYGIGDGYQNIVIRVNGRKINNIDMVAPMLSGISPSSISRIEIIKSSGIVTGGDGANAGVINITTKKNNDKSITAYAGTYHTADGSIYLGHSDETITASMSAEVQTNGGIRYLNDYNNDKDESGLRTASFDVAYTPISEIELRFNGGFTNTDLDYAGSLNIYDYAKDATSAGSSNTSQDYDTDNIGIGVSYFINNELSINLDAAVENKDSDFRNRGTYGDYVWGSHYKYHTFNANVEYVNNSFELVSGLDGFYGKRESDATAYSMTNKTKKENLAGYIMAQTRFGNSTIKAGYRYEKVSYRYTDAFNSKSDDHGLSGVEFGYNYMLDKEKSIFFNYSHGYQSPDIDRFFSYGSFNRFIDPMKTDSYTLGFNYFLPKNKFKLSVYYIDLTDEIYYYADPTYMNSKNTNIDDSSKYGIDLYNKWLINKEFALILNYNFIMAEIDDEKENGDDYSDNALPGVSKHNIKTTLSYTPNDAIRFSITQIYRSKAYSANDFTNNFLQRQDDFKSTDFSASYTKGSWEVFAKVNNIFNTENGLWIRDNSIYPVNFTTTALAGFKLNF